MSNTPPVKSLPGMVAVVDDEPVLREELTFQLQHRGFNVVAFGDAPGLYRHLATQSLAAVVLDVGLPGEDGLSVAKLLRAHNPQMGVVFVSARGRREEREAGWETGADGYLVKPIDVDELEWTLRRLLLRQTSLQPPVNRPMEDKTPKEEEPWKLVPAKALLLTPEGQPIKLTLTELTILNELVGKRGKPCKAAELARALGLQPDEWDRHRLDVIVSRLRVKVERASGHAAPLRTLRGIGYAWAPWMTDD